MYPCFSSRLIALDFNSVPAYIAPTGCLRREPLFHLTKRPHLDAPPIANLLRIVSELVRTVN